MIMILIVLVAMTVTASASPAQYNVMEKFNTSMTVFDFEMKPLTDYAWNEYGWATVVNCKEWITLRSEPSVYADSLAHMPLGSRVIFCGWARGTGFCAVKYQGMYGYALREYIRPDPGVG